MSGVRSRGTIMTEEATMTNPAAVSLATGLEDPERVTVAFLVAVGICFNARHLREGELVANARLGGTVQLGGVDQR